ncbi:MAG: hypothetical protein HC880_21085 [Bacteroidia bacterium]|nr:hypothetical protein [Bacteroidia bacterium]
MSKKDTGRRNPASGKRTDGSFGKSPRDEATIIRQQTDLHFILGRKYDEINEYDLAIEHFEQSVSLIQQQEITAHDKADIYYHLAHAYLKSDQQELAFNTFYQALEALGTDYHETSARIFYQLGNLHFRREEWEQAQENYQKSNKYLEKLSIDREVGKNYLMLGAMYANQQKNKEALIHFEQAIQHNAQSGNFEELGKTFHYLRLFLNNAMSIKINCCTTRAS